MLLNDLGKRWSLPINVIHVRKTYANHLSILSFVIYGDTGRGLNSEDELKDHPQLHSRPDIRPFAQYGIAGYLDELLVDCNPWIMAALRDQCGISTSAYSNGETDIERVLDNGRNGGLRTVYTKDAVYNVSVSKYGNRAASTAVTPM